MMFFLLFSRQKKPKKREKFCRNLQPVEATSSLFLPCHQCLFIGFRLIYDTKLWVSSPSSCHGDANC